MTKIRIIAEPPWPETERLKWVREAVIGIELFAIEQPHPDGYLVAIADVLKAVRKNSPLAAKMLREWHRENPQQILLVPRDDCRLLSDAPLSV